MTVAPQSVYEITALSDRAVIFFNNSQVCSYLQEYSYRLLLPSVFSFILKTLNIHMVA